MQNKITALVLCGGQGSRMLGQDKGRVLYQGKPLVEWVLESMTPQVDGVVISANRNLDAYQAYGWPVLEDVEPDFPGPLAGIETALQHIKSEWLMVVPCDTPFLPSDLVARLFDAAQSHGAAYAADNERDHPVIHLVRSDSLPVLQAYRAQGGAAVKGWLAAVNAVQVEFANAAVFKNFNRQDDLQA